jgi:hypothetical protein
MAAWWKRNLLLCKAFDSVPYNVDSSLVAGIEFQYCFFVGIPEQGAGKAQYTRCLSAARHTSDKEMTAMLNQLI